MYTKLALHTALALLTAVIPTLSIPPPLHPLTLTNTTLPFNALTTPGIGICPSPHTLPTLRPKYIDCVHAIRQRLPSYPGRATFHHDGTHDAFSLPVFAVWGSCEVMVVLGGRGGGQEERAGDHGVRGEESSWLEIRERAEEVNEVCRVRERSGGKIVAGEGGRVWVKLGRASVGEQWDWERAVQRGMMRLLT